MTRNEIRADLTARYGKGNFRIKRNGHIYTLEHSVVFGATYWSFYCTVAQYEYAR